MKTVHGIVTQIIPGDSLDTISLTYTFRVDRELCWKIARCSHTNGQFDFEAANRGVILYVNDEDIVIDFAPGE